MSRALSLFCLPLLSTVLPGGGLRFEGEGLWVEIAPNGVVERVPEAGLRISDGPRLELGAPLHLLHGFAFRRGALSVQGVARGDLAQPDWAERQDVEPLWLRPSEGRVEALATLAGVRIHTSYWLDKADRAIVCGIQVENTTDSVLRDILISLECQSEEASLEGWTWPSDLLQQELAPRGLMRDCWMLDDLQPGAMAGVGYSFLALEQATAGGGVDVPLRLYTSTDWPNGLEIGLSSGLSFGDYDHDGWYDLFSLQSGKLFKNEQGQTWSFAGDLRVYMNPPGARYGSAFGDYDNDGLEDIATEPRSNACLHLLQNLSGGVFLNVAPDPNIVIGRVCGADTETNCWGDVDCDGDLDLFMPIYPAWAFNGVGNRFYRNNGPVGPGGAYVLEEATQASGFDNPPPDSARPEGAQFVDVDRDGDLDLYSNGTLYQNRSATGVPAMSWMTETGSGIGYHHLLDEGAALGDYDMDGDYDLFIAYTFPNPGVTIFENEGDGTYFQVEAGVVEAPSQGIGLGLSLADWDGDGDLDFTSRQIFRRNLSLDTGEHRFVLATTSIPDGHLSSASPAWADWDRDGDLDCALANIGTQGHFYENTQYDAGTPLADRRYVRVRLLRDQAGVSEGLASELGASVELDIQGDTSGLLRRQFTSTSNGYLNQNEYPLTFALPADPAPENPEVDLHFALTVDFPSLPEQGQWRIDRRVHPVLGDIDLATLTEREIRIWRGGRVEINGVVYEPCDAESARLSTAAGGLSVADPVAGLPPPQPPASGDEWVGLDFDTFGAIERVRLVELVLDGHLGAAVSCGSSTGNVQLWDITAAGNPELVPLGAYELATRPRNHRSYLPLDSLLERERHYRLIARADLVRETSFQGPAPQEGMTVQGGLSFPANGTCPATEIEQAQVDPTRLWLSVRFAAVTGIERYCASTTNSTGSAAVLDALGSPSVGFGALAIWARQMPANKFAQVFYGSIEAQNPFGDGYLCMSGHLYRLSRPSQADANGELLKPVDFQAHPLLQPGTTWRFQTVFHDPSSGGTGFNTTDALRIRFCP